MKYSCFNPASGLYRVYEDSREIPINGDLPVPSLGADAGGIGVPSIDAARPLPRGARYVEDSWVPVGIVVQCGGGVRRALSGLAGPGLLPIPTSALGWGVLVAAAAASVLAYRWVTR